MNISPMKRVVRFGKKGKLSPYPRYVGPYEMFKQVRKVAFNFKLPSELAHVDPFFHVSILKKCVADPVSILRNYGLEVDENLTYEEVPVEILDHHLKKLRNKSGGLCKNSIGKPPSYGRNMEGHVRQAVPSYSYSLLSS